MRRKYNKTNSMMELKRRLIEMEEINVEEGTEGVLRNFNFKKFKTWKMENIFRQKIIIHVLLAVCSLAASSHKTAPHLFSSPSISISTKKTNSLFSVHFYLILRKNPMTSEASKSRLPWCRDLFDLTAAYCRFGLWSLEKRIKCTWWRQNSRICWIATLCRWWNRASTFSAAFPARTGSRRKDWP